MRQLNPAGIRADLGSFWYENITEESQNKLRLLLEAVTGSVAYTSVNHALHRVVDQSEPLHYENITAVARWTAVQYEGATWWRAGITTTSSPVLLEQAGKQYVAGVDFVYDHNTRDILFPEKPAFDSFVIRLGLADDAGAMFHSVLYGLFMQTRMGHANLIANYLRGDHHPESFENALRAQVGLKRVERGGRLLERQDLTDETVYVFTDEVIRVPYSHVKFNQGSVIKPGVWIGSELVALSIYDGTDDWYRVRNEWGNNGLDLKPIIGYGLTATDGDETVADSGGQTRFPLQEDTAGDLAKFWQRALDRESVYGGGLEQKYSVGSTVNPLDVFFQDFLDHVMILTVNARVLLPQAVVGLRNWFTRHCPFGYLPIVRVVTEAEELNYSQYAPTITGVLNTCNFYETFGYLVYNEGFLDYNGYPLTNTVDLGQRADGIYANDVLGFGDGYLQFGGDLILFL